MRERYAPSTARLPPPFTVPLRVPGILAPVRRTRRHGLLRGRPTRRRDRDPARVAHDGLGLQRDVSRTDHRLANEAGTPLSRIRTRSEVPVVVHLHGGRVPPEHDGFPTDFLQPIHGHAGHESGGMTHTGSTTVGTGPTSTRGPAGWDALYHDHRMDFTGPQVYRGLAGFHLVADDHEATSAAPARGRAADDRRPQLPRDGTRLPVARPHAATPGSRASMRVVSSATSSSSTGVPWPVFEVEAVRYRSRLLNASNARRYALSLDPDPSGTGLPFLQIGADASLMPARCRSPRSC